MSNVKRLMRMDFSRYNLYKMDGFTKEIFIKLLEQLPEGTEIRGFSERCETDMYSLLISHDSFMELKEVQRIPQILVTVTKPDIITLEWPEEYKKTHTCSYKTYQGFSKTEEICTVCGKTK